MIKTIALTTTCCLFYFTIFSQSSLSGIITNQKGEPLSFVNILINNSQKDGVSTDIAGKFNIQYKSTIKKLPLSYIGYESPPSMLKTTNLKEKLDYYVFL